MMERDDCTFFDWHEERKARQCGIVGTGLRQVKIVGKWQITMISVRLLIIGSIQRIYN